MIHLFWAYSYGLTKDRLRLYFRDLAKIPVVAPPKREQTRIAKILSKSDQVIDQLNQLTERKRRLKENLAHQLLTGKRRFPSFSDKWLKVPLKELCERIESGGTPSTSRPEYWQGEIPWISGSDISANGVDSPRRFISPTAVDSSATRILPKGTLLVVSRVGVGKIAVAPTPLAISQDITALTLTSRVDSAFLRHELIASISALQRLNQGTSISGITREDLAAHQVRLPSVPEQKKIAAALSAIEREALILTNISKSFQVVRANLMRSLLTSPGFGRESL